jgi:hypothetical protein
VIGYIVTMNLNTLECFEGKLNWICRILHSNCILKYVTVGNIGTGRRGRRHRQLVDDLKETRRYGDLKEQYYLLRCGELALEEALDLS